MPIADTLAKLARGLRCRCLLLAAPVLILTQVTVVQARAHWPLFVELEGDSAAGHVRVSWSADADSPEDTAAAEQDLQHVSSYELQRATAADFQDGLTQYQGEHTASVLSGLLDGVLFFRVRARYDDGSVGAWSEVQSFEVQHHSRDMALAFFFAGLLIFAATAGFLWFFSRRVPTDD